MAVTVAIKSVPDDLADALRERARRNHRSLQGELMVILEEAVSQKPFQAHTLLRRIRRLGVKTPADATQAVREARDSR